MLKIMWKREEIAPEEQFLLLSTIFCYLVLDFYVETRIRFSLRDKRLFEITEVEITRVDCILQISKSTAFLIYFQNNWHKCTRAMIQMSMKLMRMDHINFMMIWIILAKMYSANARLTLFRQPKIRFLK